MTMPALTISTDNPGGSRSSSPNRPSVSPITPTLPSASLPDAPPPRQTFTHSQPNQTGFVPPPPEPIAFDSNPDVIALKSAITVLQMQSQRATADIQKLSRIKNEAVSEPEAFLRDLTAGRVSDKGASTDDMEVDEEEEDSNSGPSSRPATAAGSREWNSLPQPQNVIRTPPINWSQYAVVGESLDKLHADQVARPSQGTPAIIGANGAYEFKGEGKKEEYIGVASPYAPSRDKVVAKKSRAKK